MGLAISLDLGGLVKTFPLDTGFGVLAIDPFAGAGLDDRKHPAVREIAVVRDGEHASAGLVLVGRHPLPKVAGVVAAEWRQDRIRHDAARLVAVIPEDHVPVEVVAAGVRRPLVADKGREAAGGVRLLRRLDGLLPSRAVSVAVRAIEQRLRELALGKGDNDLDRRIRPLSADDHVVPSPPGRIGHNVGFGGEQVWKKAHVVGVIGHDKEVERPREFCQLAR
jgi:hypothetical protein